ncbi:ADP-ribosylation factor family-domain-containing protein [Aspergillus karnatakaensis]|uniref:ADP-ribosylation factor family-domain-containing protein n=1 Tax=Aspergillus karnatakaensis TaxID=1810916 RepID=UPI003CCE4CB6
MASILQSYVMSFAELIFHYLSYILLRLQGITKETKILLVGLDNTGKTTLLHKWSAETARCRQHPGLIDYKHIRYTIIDTGGMAAPPLSSYLPYADGIVFMVDMADYERLAEAARMLDSLLGNETVEGVPIIVLGNKIDKPGAVGPEEFRALLGLGWDQTAVGRIRRGRAFEVLLGSVALGYGCREVLDWLACHV